MRFSFKKPRPVNPEFIRTLARRIVYDDPKRQLKRDEDLPEVELEKEDKITLSRALPKSARASVIINDSFMEGRSSGVCAFPSFWYFKNKKTFGCPRCPEQDVCPLYQHIYARKNFKKDQIYLAGEHQFDSMDLALEYYDLPLRTYKKIVKHPFAEYKVIASDPVPDLDRNLKFKFGKKNDRTTSAPKTFKSNARFKIRRK